MPTKRPRHTTAETPAIEAALAELRGDGVARHQARSRLAESVRARSLPIDVEPANQVKRIRLPR